MYKITSLWLFEIAGEIFTSTYDSNITQTLQRLYTHCSFH